jgi:hypothetical protein
MYTIINNTVSKWYKLFTWLCTNDGSCFQNPVQHQQIISFLHTDICDGNVQSTAASVSNHLLLHLKCFHHLNTVSLPISSDPYASSNIPLCKILSHTSALSHMQYFHCYWDVWSNISHKLTFNSTTNLLVAAIHHISDCNVTHEFSRYTIADMQ